MAASVEIKINKDRGITTKLPFLKKKKSMQI
jgi:hypothetical protein